MTGAIMLILASLSFRISFTEIPAAATAFINAISESPVMVMLIINLLLLVVGCVMDMGPAIRFFTAHPAAHRRRRDMTPYISAA